VHECSRTPATPFVALNCAAIPRELIESELFGYKRGAFSGATIDYPGLFRAAEGGSLFLDEITEMSAATQSKLLRALQERTVRPVGSTREVTFDVRVIACSNRDPQVAVREGHLRQDLYYRLQVNLIEVPPLRERLADIPPADRPFHRAFQPAHDEARGDRRDRTAGARLDESLQLARQRARAFERD
jgi:transcriptional regulator with PAS, ATPase and Fis domain